MQLRLQSFSSLYRISGYHCNECKRYIFYVTGINGTSGILSAAPKAAKIGVKNKVKANFYVPNGTLWIMMNSDAEGAFIAKDISIGVRTKIKLNSAF